jgi:hypothetical protein
MTTISPKPEQNNGELNPEPLKRPLGLSLLTFLFFYSFGFSAWFFIADRDVSIFQGVYPGVSSPVPVYYMLFAAAALSLGACIGLWLGRPWGWFTGVVMYFVDLVRHCNDLLTTLQGINAPTPSQAESSPVAGAAIPLIVQLLVVVYLFKDNVFVYLRMGRFTKVNAFNYALLGVLGLYGVGILLEAIF